MHRRLGRHGLHDGLLHQRLNLLWRDRRSQDLQPLGFSFVGFDVCFALGNAQFLDLDRIRRRWNLGRFGLEHLHALRLRVRCLDFKLAGLQCVVCGLVAHRPLKIANLALQRGHSLFRLRVLLLEHALQLLHHRINLAACLWRNHGFQSVGYLLGSGPIQILRQQVTDQASGLRKYADEFHHLRGRFFAPAGEARASGDGHVILARRQIKDPRDSLQALDHRRGHRRQVLRERHILRRLAGLLGLLRGHLALLDRLQLLRLNHGLIDRDSVGRAVLFHTAHHAFHAVDAGDQVKDDAPAVLYSPVAIVQIVIGGDIAFTLAGHDGAA